MSRAENALMRLYEDADLRDELTDDEADQMLKWAEAELTRLDASVPDDAVFESQVDTLLKMLKKINRFAGRQGQLSAQVNDQAPESIAALATELGHPASADQVVAAGTGDPSGTLAALLGLMSAAPAQAAPPETTPAETTPSPDQPAPLAETPPAQPKPPESTPAETTPLLDQPASLPETPSLETASAEAAPSPDQPVPPSVQPPTDDSPDIPFGAYVDEYDL